MSAVLNRLVEIQIFFSFRFLKVNMILYLIKYVGKNVNTVTFLFICNTIHVLYIFYPTWSVILVVALCPFYLSVCVLNFLFCALSISNPSSDVLSQSINNSLYISAASFKCLILKNRVCFCIWCLPECLLFQPPPPPPPLPFLVCYAELNTGTYFFMFRESVGIWHVYCLLVNPSSHLCHSVPCEMII